MHVHVHARISFACANALVAAPQSRLALGAEYLALEGAPPEVVPLHPEAGRREEVRRALVAAARVERLVGKLLLVPRNLVADGSLRVCGWRGGGGGGGGADNPATVVGDGKGSEATDLVGEEQQATALAVIPRRIVDEL